MKKTLLLIILVSLMTAPFRVMAQDANSMFFMRGVPQTYHVNPALQPEFKFFLGLPGLAPFKFNLQMPLGVSDLFVHDPLTDSTYYFLHSRESKDDFLNALKEFNNFTLDLSTSIASIGFRARQSYISFDIREKAYVDIGYSKDFFQLPLNGFVDGAHNNLDMDFTISAYSEWSMGISRKIGDRLTVGWRGKLLFGQANLNTPHFNIDLETSEEQWVVDADIQARASAPYLLDYVVTATQVPFSTAFGDFDNVDIGSPSLSEIREMVINPANFGLAMDLGADFRIFDWLQLSASIIDFGSIKWDSMVNIDYKVNFVYNGIDGGNLDEGFEEVFLDSLETTFDKFTTKNDRYRTMLPAKVYIGAAVYPHPKVSFGLLSRTDIYNGRFREQLTVSANLYPIKMFSTTLSYSLIQGRYSSYGFGLALKLLPFNMYMMTDIGPSLTLYQVPVSETENLPFGLPIDLRNINFKIGMNIMLGGPKRADKIKAPVYDLPLID